MGCGNFAALQDGEKILRARLHQALVADGVEGLRLHRAGTTGLRHGLAVSPHLVHDGLPPANGHGRIAGSQIGAGNLDIQECLPERFIPGVKQNGGFMLVAGSEAGLFASGRVLAVEDAGAAKQDET